MTPMTAAIARSVVAPAITISHRTFATMRAAAGSRGASSSAESFVMALQGRSETLVIAAEEVGERLDRVLAHRVAELSRSRHKALILAGRVAIDGATIRDPGHRVNAGATIVLDLPPAEDGAVEPENIPLDVVFEDADLIVIDKPAGLVVHPAAGNWTGTLVNALVAHCGESLSGVGGVKRPGIVHRLDKDTSGLIVVAKTDRAHRALARQFADHGRSGPLRRGYLAFVWGAPEASLLACRLETGRTHQIRVHLAAIGHPLLGDAVYGGGFKTKASQLGDDARAALDALGRQGLHAYLLGIEHPSQGTNLEFRSELPDDLLRLRHSLGAQGTAA